MKFNLRKPCDNCPFRTNIPAYLNSARVRDIENSLVRGQQNFACHKTTVAGEGGPVGDDGNDDNGYMVETPDTEHCAGAMILLEGLNQPNQMMRIAGRLGMYDYRKLDMSSPVYNTFESMRKAQPK